MTKSEAVLKVQEHIGSEYGRDELMAFIIELDMRARIDILGEDTSENGFKSEQLVLPSPYDMAYVYHAVSKVNFEREEFSLYNNYHELAQELFTSYARLYNRTYGYKVKKVKGLW